MINTFSAFFSWAALGTLNLPTRSCGLHEVFLGASSARRLSMTQSTPLHLRLALTHLLL
jgi:hypothetical protein